MTEITKKINAPIIVLICAFYTAFRFWGMTDSCLWFDEIFSVHAAEHPWETMFSFAAKDLIHPPLFYILLKLWITIGGEGLFWMRLLPVIFAIISLFPFWMICRELKLKPPAAIVAMSFFAVNGSLIKYAQEVRMYSLLMCLSLFSTWLFSRFYFRGKNFWLLTAVNVLLVYTHYFGWLVVIAEVVAILIRQRMKILRILMMFAVTMAGFLPWIFAIFRFAEPGPGVEQNIGWIARPGFTGIFEFAFDVIEPFYYQPSNADPSSKFLVVIPLLLFIALAKIIYLINFRNAEEKDAVYLMSVFSLVPLTIAFFASWILPVSVWGSRHLIFAYVPMMIVIAIFITSVSIKPLRYALAGAVYLLFVFGLIINLRAEKQNYVWCAWEQFAQHIPTDKPQTVYVFEDLIAYHFWFSTRNNQNLKIVKVNGIPDMTEDKAYFLPRGFDGVINVDAARIAGLDIWIAFRFGKVDIGRPPISSLNSLGYQVKETIEFPAGTTNAYLIRAEKKE